MNGKDNIIANILSAAEAQKTEILNAAQAKADAIAKEDESFAEKLREKTLSDCEKNEKLAIERAVTLANMDVKKLTLQTKQAKISEVFSKAEKFVLSLDDEKYLQFILSLLDKYAEDGDTLVVATADKERISEQQITAYAQKKGVALSYRADGAFSGGVILENEKYDKNLTVSMLLKEFKAERETEIATILAGE